MWNPGLIQVQRTKRPSWIKRAVVAGVAACLAAVLLSVSARAEDAPIAVIYSEKYMEQLNAQRTEVGIAPGTEAGSNAYNTLEALELPGAAYLPFPEDISRIFYKEWTDAGLELADMFVILDIESDGSGDGVILDKGDAVSGTHDYGWFQVNWPSWKGTAKQLYGVTSPGQLMDPHINVRMAIYVYGDCVARYGRGSRAWSCYNTGKGYNSTKYSRKAAAALAIWEERLKQ